MSFSWLERNPVDIVIGKRLVLRRIRRTGRALRRALAVVRAATATGLATHRAAELLNQHFHGPALAAVLRLEVAHLQFTAAPDLLALVQRPLAERLGTLAQRLDGDPGGALVVAVAVSHGHAGGPDGGAPLRILQLGRGGQSASERVVIQVAHAASFCWSSVTIDRKSVV